jgi:hypothetical protein
MTSTSPFSESFGLCASLSCAGVASVLLLEAPCVGAPCFPAVWWWLFWGGLVPSPRAFCRVGRPFGLLGAWCCVLPAFFRVCRLCRCGLWLSPPPLVGVALVCPVGLRLPLACFAACCVASSCVCVFVALARGVSFGSLGCRPACPCVCVCCVCALGLPVLPLAPPSSRLCAVCAVRFASARCLCRSLPPRLCAVCAVRVSRCRLVCALSVPFVVARALGCLCCPWRRRSWLLRLRAVCAVRGCLGPAPCLSGGPSGFVCPPVAFFFSACLPLGVLGCARGLGFLGLGAAGCSFAR